MFESIKKVKEQFEWMPEILGNFEFKNFKRIIVCGMGGSNLASGFLEMLRPDLEIVAHRSYGLPTNTKKDDLVIISSYSGNTEEALDSFEKAINAGLVVIVVTVGGRLLELAKEKSISYIQIPQTGIEPRMALGYSLLAMLKAVDDEENLKKAQEFGKIFEPEKFEKEGIALAEKLPGKTPVIYSSWANKAIAYTWKVKFNETAKVPAFFNIFPELNHNEMVGFLTLGAPTAVGESVCGGIINPYFIFLKDSSDHQLIQKRMEITQSVLKDKGFEVYISDTNDTNLHPNAANSYRIAKIFNSLTLADWASYHFAQNSNFDPEDSSVIEEFKKKLKSRAV